VPVLKLLGLVGVASAALALGASATAAPASKSTLFRMGSAWCSATVVPPTHKLDFVSCSTRIRGAWRDVSIDSYGTVVRSSAPPLFATSGYRSRSSWRGDRFGCSAAGGGAICTGPRGHGFRISSAGISTF
jgi:hypothetical protein